jgi:hypothetical protein
MNIEVEDHIKVLIEEVCKKMNQTPSQLVAFLLASASMLYLSYEKERKAGIEKRPFEQILGDLFKHSFISKLRTLDVADMLITNTKRLIGIEDHIGGGIIAIKPDLDRRRFSYIVSFDYCSDSAQITYTPLVVEVAVNQDYIEVSQLVVLPIVPGVRITENDLMDTNDFLQRHIEDKYGKKKKLFLPFANISVKLSTIDYQPFDPRPDIHMFMEIRLTVKADKAIHIPPIEKTFPIMEEILPIVEEELLAE